MVIVVGDTVSRSENCVLGYVITLMDSIYCTIKYGFSWFFVTVKTSIGSGGVVATIILR